MNIAAKFLVFGALLTVAAPLALADSVPGVLNVGGGASYNTYLLSFIKPFNSTADTDFFSSYSGGAVDYLLGTVNYMDVITSPLEAFTITNKDGDVLAFYDTDNQATSGIDPSTNLWDITLDETGYYTINGGPELNGFFDLSLVGTSRYASTDSTFLGSGGLGNIPAMLPDFAVLAPSFAAMAPEPASCFLLGSGLLATVGLLYTRRRRAGLTA